MPEPLPSAPLDTAEAPKILFGGPLERSDRAPSSPPDGTGRSAPAETSPEASDTHAPEWMSERPVDFQPISRTKITPPIVRRETLTRGRLIEWLRRHTQRRLTLVIAEAGYGKTTLLADYGRHSEMACLWYKLDASDGDWVTLANYLVAAIREIRPEFGAATVSLLRQMATADTPRRLVIDTLLAEVAALADRALLILDDFHLVDTSRDVEEIVGRLLREAPPGLSFVIASRRRPELALARAAAQGEVGQLATDDLRFSRGETDELFSETYEQPLEPDVLDQVERKTEGWAASLQLFHSSIRGRSGLEIRAFARSLSGTEGPVYDFLAEEVLRELTPPLRRFLVGSSILERIVPRHVVAIFAAEPEPPTDTVARGWIDAADDLGLMGRRGESGRGYRFHPLLREFLLRQLERDVGPEVIRAMHQRVARAAEGQDWLAACHHYLEGGEPSNAIRVMGDSLLVAIGTGAWGMAATILDRLGDEPDAPAVQVILALREIQQGDVAAAEARLHAIDLESAPAKMRSLVRHALLRATFNRGDLEASHAIVDAILADPDSPPLVKRLAASFGMLYLEETQDLDVVARRLQRLGQDCRHDGLTYFAAVSFHNAMEAYLAAGRWQNAYECGEIALEQFAESSYPGWVGAATHASLGVCAAELGWDDVSTQHLETALAFRDCPEPDVLCVAASLLAARGDSRADELIAASWQRAKSEPMSITSISTLRLASARAAIARGDVATALEVLDRAADMPSTAWVATDVALLGMRALTHFANGELELARLEATRTLTRARHIGAQPWKSRLEIIIASASRDPAGLSSRVQAAARVSGLALSDVADAIVAGLDLLQPLPDCVIQSATTNRSVWRASLRRRIANVPGAASFAAARLLEAIGTLEDVPLLRAYERGTTTAIKNANLSRYLAERVSPPLQVGDLGQTEWQVGDRRVLASRIRRRAASVLVYLIARPRQMASREKVLDDLWPDLTPSAAANSLNQTLYFLRRDIDPWYEDGVSVDYIRFEGETLSLFPDLVKVESVEFHKAATHLLARRDSDLRSIEACLRQYRGRFAPEFEYEDWTFDWREQLHTTYLDLVSRAQRECVANGDLDTAVAVSRAALSLDPRNTDLHEALVWLLLAIGSRPAAAEQYAHYATVHREDVGAEPLRLDELARRPLLSPRVDIRK